MPRFYNYSLARVEDQIRRGNLTEPFVKCVAVYQTRSNVIDAMIDGFSIDSIKQPSAGNNEVEITAVGSATVENMKTGDIDKSPTIYVGFDVNPIQRKKTVSVTLTDSKNKTFVWDQSNEEGRH